MSSTAACFSLDQSKILLSGSGLRTVTRTVFKYIVEKKKEKMLVISRFSCHDNFCYLFIKDINWTLDQPLVLSSANAFKRSDICWLVVLEFNATLTAKVISWRSVTHMCFLAFSHQY